MNYDVRVKTLKFSCLEHLVTVHLESLRHEGHYAEADAIRAQLVAAGYNVKYEQNGSVRLTDAMRSPMADTMIRMEQEEADRNDKR